MSDVTISLNGEHVTLLPEGALWWEGQGLLAVADLHFEKGSSYGMRGQFLPPYDTRATLARLTRLVKRHRPRTIVALGDSFHDIGGPDRLYTDDRTALTALTGACEFIWIEGNHDADAAAACGGVAMEEFARGQLIFRHKPAPRHCPGEVCGHLHPKASVVVKGRHISRFCYLSDGRRMVMPAFGAYTGGLDAMDQAFFPVFPSGFNAYLMGRGRVYAFPADQLYMRSAA